MSFICVKTNNPLRPLLRVALVLPLPLFLVALGCCSPTATAYPPVPSAHASPQCYLCFSAIAPIPRPLPAAKLAWSCTPFPAPVARLSCASTRTLPMPFNRPHTYKLPRLALPSTWVALVHAARDLTCSKTHAPCLRTVHPCPRGFKTR